MVKEIVFYVEGGNNKTADIDFRKAFHQFFAEIGTRARQKGIKFTITLEGPRKKAYERFCYTAVNKKDVYPVLLVDSEEPVKNFGRCWQHLKARDDWDCPPGVDDRQCHLMVQTMEAWYFADPEGLSQFYQSNFRANTIPQTQDVEQIPKAQHLLKLEAAVKNTSKQHYHKFKHAPEILMRLDVDKVRRRALHCNRIFTTLETVIKALPQNT